MVQRILDDDKGGAPQERTQSERQFRAKPFRRFGNIPLLLEVFVEFRGFTALIQRDGKKKRAKLLGRPSLLKICWLEREANAEAQGARVLEEERQAVPAVPNQSGLSSSFGGHVVPC